MCREALPVWQQVHERHHDEGITVLGVAVGAEGRRRAAPYVDAADVEYDILLDESFELGEVFGFAMLRNVVLVDESGVVEYIRSGGFDLREAESLALVEVWIAGQPVVAVDAEIDPVPSPAVGEALSLGSRAWRDGDRDRAIAHWARALELDPGNHLARDQLWSVEYPERYYAGDVDKAWQAQRLGTTGHTAGHDQ